MHTEHIVHNEFLSLRQYPHLLPIHVASPMAFCSHLVYLVNVLSQCAAALNTQTLEFANIQLGGFNTRIHVSEVSLYNDLWAAVTARKWEWYTQDIFKKCITNSTSVIDFGSWIGPTVLFAAHLAKVVYAFEPDPTAFAELTINVMLNKFSNVKLHNMAICPQSGLKPFFVETGNSKSSFVSKRSSNGSSWRTVSCTTITQLAQANDIAAPMFIKMDVEGFEAELLAAMKPFFQLYRPILYVSIHGRRVRHFSYDQLSGMRDALSIFPYVYNNRRKLIRKSSLLYARRAAELLLTWELV